MTRRAPFPAVKSSSIQTQLQTASPLASGSSPISTCRGWTLEERGLADRIFRLHSLKPSPRTLSTRTSISGRPIASRKTSPLSTRLAKAAGAFLGFEFRPGGRAFLSQQLVDAGAHGFEHGYAHVVF